jgi:hypothetical protein
MLNHGNTLVQLLHYLSLTSCESDWTLPTAAQLLLSQSQQGNLVGHQLRLSNVLERIYRHNCEPLYATNTSRRKQETFLYEYPLHRVLLPTKTHNRILLFGSTHLNHGRHFDYWNQPLHMRMHVCYLYCHEGGLCCYTVIYIENLLRPLQLFYFHFWPIYWLSFVIHTRARDSNLATPEYKSEAIPLEPSCSVWIFSLSPPLSPAKEKMFMQKLLSSIFGLRERERERERESNDRIE